MRKKIITFHYILEKNRIKYFISIQEYKSKMFQLPNVHFPCERKIEICCEVLRSNKITDIFINFMHCILINLMRCILVQYIATISLVYFSPLLEIMLLIKNSAQIVKRISCTFEFCREMKFDAVRNNCTFYKFRIQTGERKSIS